jgi:hypothetical protein
MLLQNVQGIVKTIFYLIYLFIIISLVLFYRGFGFITFKDANSVDKVLTSDVHMLDEKQVCSFYTSV